MSPLQNNAKAPSGILRVQSQKMWTFFEISSVLTLKKKRKSLHLGALSVMFFNSSLDRRKTQSLVSSAAEKCRTGQRSCWSETSWSPFLGNKPDLFWWLIFHPVKFFGLRPSCCCRKKWIHQISDSLVLQIFDFKELFKQ